MVETAMEEDRRCSWPMKTFKPVCLVCGKNMTQKFHERSKNMIRYYWRCACGHKRLYWFVRKVKGSVLWLRREQL
ncbi:MAG: hypothetical protein KAV87_50425 [Desulfobacteraceae bacterium]|nr:hypothetical protein [Desulfobacteraceae bacterium]